MINEGDLCQARASALLCLLLFCRGVLLLCFALFVWNVHLSLECDTARARQGVNKAAIDEGDDGLWGQMNNSFFGVLDKLSFLFGQMRNKGGRD